MDGMNDFWITSYLVIIKAFVACDSKGQVLSFFVSVAKEQNSKLFIGTVEDLSKIDKRLSTKLQVSNVTQVALIEVWGDNQPLGILGVTWSEHEVLNTYGDKIKNIIYQHSHKVRSILN